MIYINVYQDEKQRPYSETYDDQTTAIEEIEIPGLTYLHTIEDNGETLVRADYEPLLEQLNADRYADYCAERIERSAYMAGAV